MKRSIRYALLLCLFLATFAYGNITIEGETVHVETDNYIVQFNKGVIEYIHNKLTDETYTLSPGTGKRGWTGLLNHRYFWRDENVSTYKTSLISAQEINPRRAELLFHQEGTEVRLFIAVDPMTDDLLIDMEGESDTPGVIGMQWGLSYVDIQHLSIIAPVDGGRIFDSTTPDNYEYHPYPGSGSGWEAQLAIVHGKRGGFYIRNTDNTFQFKHFIYDRLDDGVALHFGTHNQAPFDTHTTGNTEMWRFNTYVGNWRVPARLYWDWMEPAFDARRLSDMPPWVEDITLFINRGLKVRFAVHGAVLLDKLAEFVDPTKTLVMVKEWSIGRGDWWREGLVHYPEYEPMPELRNLVETAHRHGFRVILYADLISFSVDHPLYPEFVQYQYRDTWTRELLGWKWDDLTHPHRHALINPASSEFRKILVQELKAIWEEYDVDGFFMDASHYVVNDANGLIDGLNSAQGNALLHQELAEAMPGVALGGERLHEATFARESFAERPILTKKTQAHPITTFLFSPFTHAVGGHMPTPDFNPFPDDYKFTYQEHLSFYEIWGVMPTLFIWDVKQLRPERVETHAVLEMARNWQNRYGLNGDVNGDGVVNILDLTLVGQNIGVPFVLPEADLNGDGQVNILDLILVANMFEGAAATK